MALYTALELPVEKKIEIVKAYLVKGSSLRKTARLYGISYMTLWRWVKRYKKGSKETFNKVISYKQSHRRFSSRIEKKVMLLKEHEPCLTTKKAVHLLKQQGLPMSHNGVWMIWKRYGLVKRPKHDPLSLICSGTPEIENGMQQARLFIKNGDIENAARLLNKLPCLTDPSILKQIPDGFLSLRRRSEQLHFLFLSKAMPLLDLLNKVRKIRKTMERSGYLFSSIFAGFLEVFILQWMKVPEKQLKILNLISFTLYMLLAITHGKLLHVNDAIVNIRKCHRLLGSLPYPFYWLAFGDALMSISRGKEGILCFKKIIKEMKDEQIPNQIFYMKIAHGYVMTGQYQQAQKFLNRIKSKETDVVSSVRNLLAWQKLRTFIILSLLPHWDWLRLLKHSVSKKRLMLYSRNVCRL
jgi:transposase